MHLVINLYRNAVHGEEIHQDAFCEGDWTTTTTINKKAKVYQGRFYPISTESIDFSTEKITSFDGRQSDRTIEYDVFLN